MFVSNKKLNIIFQSSIFTKVRTFNKTNFIKRTVDKVNYSIRVLESYSKYEKVPVMFSSFVIRCVIKSDDNRVSSNERSPDLEKKILRVENMPGVSAQKG